MDASSAKSGSETRQSSGSVSPVRPSTISLPQETWDALRRESKATHISQAEIIRQALAIRRTVLALAAAADAGQPIDQLLAALLKLSGRESD